MKFNVLVVAAMVIASVNAVWHDNLPSGVENSGDMSKAESEESLLQGWNEPKVPKPIKDDSKCDPIVEKLTDLRRETYNIEDELRERMPTYFNLMKGMDADGKKINPSILKAEQVTAYLELSDEKKATVEGFKTEYAGVMERYDAIWGEFIDSRCFTEDLLWMSPDEMIKRGPFPKLQDENDVDIPNEQ
ncbi:hypothetical protein BASA60_006557 [Batrachochytrium salamandrivorans]|nr:hypothetical protein BASA60_006557 [Batrachochytrium salamandrivorans]